MAYQEYERTSDFSYYIRARERELSTDVQQLQQQQVQQQTQEEPVEAGGPQVFEHPEGTEFVGADEPPPPEPTPTPLPDFS